MGKHKETISLGGLPAETKSDAIDEYIDYYDSVKRSFRFLIPSVDARGSLKVAVMRASLQDVFTIMDIILTKSQI